MPHVALYCRISQDRAGRREGVETQQQWGRHYAERAWPGEPIVVYSDNDLTAADATVDRPGYRALREAIVHGDVTHVWAVEQSRLERTEIGWFELAAIFDAAGITEVHTNRDGIVRVGDEVAGIKAVLAAAEVRRLKRRIRDKLDVLAAEGRPGGKAPFGYRNARDGDGRATLTIVPAEADAIRFAAAKVLSGWSLANIAAELEQRGHSGRHGGRLRPDSIRRVLSSPTLAGLRVQRGEIVGSGIWEPTLDEATWRAVNVRLGAPRIVVKSNGDTYRLSGQRRTVARRYLLTGGIAVCGPCGHPLVGSVLRRKGQARPYLLCHPQTGGGACVGILAEPTEQHVVDNLLDELDKPEVLDALATDDHQQRRDAITTALVALDGRRAELAALWGRGDVTAAEWGAARAALDDEQHRLLDELAVLPPTVEHVDPKLLRQGWAAMTLDERREVIGMFVSKVIVSKAIPGARVFNPARIEIVWRHG